jgi:hypothetical protein
VTELEELRTELAAAFALLDAARKQRNESREKCAGLQREVALLRTTLKCAAIDVRQRGGMYVNYDDNNSLVERWTAQAGKYYPGLAPH